MDQSLFLAAAFFALCRCRRRCRCDGTTLQEKAWLVYVVLLLLSVLYRFALSGGFSGDPVVLRPGAPISSARSDTHHLTLRGESVEE